MKLPILLSVPHAGLKVPPEVEDLCILSQEEIIQDGDEGAAEIYLPLREEVAKLVTTDVARAILDMNRPVNDRSKDGIVKTHTCWDVPVYRRFPSEETVGSLIGKHHIPYHVRLSQVPTGIQLGVDCHTMAAKAPPIARDPGANRPILCISNGGSTCPENWINGMAACFEEVFKEKVHINTPFKGGHIIRTHAAELPWVQLELSRAPFASLQEKSRLVLESLRRWYRITPECF
jgi:N-formylglutamate amidohydrolase